MNSWYHSFTAKYKTKYITKNNFFAKNITYYKIFEIFEFVLIFMFAKNKYYGTITIRFNILRRIYK